MVRERASAGGEVKTRGEAVWKVQMKSSREHYVCALELFKTSSGSRRVDESQDILQSNYGDCLIKLLLTLLDKFVLQTTAI